MAADQQQRGGRDEVGVFHPSVGPGIRRHSGEQIVSRLLAVALDQPSHIPVQIAPGLLLLATLRFGLRR